MIGSPNITRSWPITSPEAKTGLRRWNTAVSPVTGQRSHSLTARLSNCMPKP